MHVNQQTLYIAPGGALYSRIYLLPYPMRPGQSPRDILPVYQAAWREVGQMNWEGQVVCLDPVVAHLKTDLEGQIAGTFFETPLPLTPVTYVVHELGDWERNDDDTASTCPAPVVARYATLGKVPAGRARNQFCSMLQAGQAQVMIGRTIFEIEGL